MKRISIAALTSALLLAYLTGSARADEVTVFAAASLVNALTDVAKAYRDAGGDTVKTSFAASSALAKQVENGAPADLFISADLKWMDYLDGKGKIEGGSRVNLLGNELVLIAPKGHGFTARLEKGADLAAAFPGKLCTGEPAAVPVGIYAKEALQNLGMWEGIQSRVVGTEDVRAALNFVERGECDAGIVYRTDAMVSAKVESVAVFPADSHAPVIYPAGLVTHSASAKAFLDYLKSAPAAEVFRKYGFEVLPQALAHAN